MAAPLQSRTNPASKVLSTGTLSLRFMQNAHRAKQLAQVEAEQAQVKDEAEWEVDKEVREAWGLAGGSSSSQAARSVVYEASYMPFLFDQDASDGDAGRPKGRRIFGKHGKEVEEVIAPPPDFSQLDPANNGDKMRRLTSISGSGPSAQTKPKDDKRPAILSKGPEKSAKDIIRDNSGIGTDLRSRTGPNPPHHIPAQPITLEDAFLKPSGVDSPKLGSGVIQGARAKSKTFAKRPREGDAEASPSPAEDSGFKDSKRKKKSKLLE